MSAVYDDYLKCSHCSQEHNEGIFCRCESRNIRIAKESRSRGNSPWKNKNDDEIVIKEKI